MIDEILDDTPIGFSPYEDIAACAMAMDCISDMDGKLMSREDEALIEDIKRMSLKIIHTGIKEIYESNFYAEKEAHNG